MDKKQLNKILERIKKRDNPQLNPGKLSKYAKKQERGCYHASNHTH